MQWAKISVYIYNVICSSLDIVESVPEATAFFASFGKIMQQKLTNFDTYFDSEAKRKKCFKHKTSF